MAGYSGNGVASAPMGILIDAMRASEQEDVDRWLIGHNPMLTAGDFGTVPGRRGRGDQRDGTARSDVQKVLRLPDRLPGAWLPSPAELAVAARGAPLAGMLAGLAEWVGQGRPLARDAQLPAASRRRRQTGWASRLRPCACCGSTRSPRPGSGWHTAPTAVHIAVPGEMAADWLGGADGRVGDGGGALRGCDRPVRGRPRQHAGHRRDARPGRQGHAELPGPGVAGGREAVPSPGRGRAARRARA